MLLIKKDYMNIREIAKRLAVQFKMPRADRYDLFLREFDNVVEVLGFVPDPNVDMRDYQGREMLFPKRWVTIGTVSADTKVS